MTKVSKLAAVKTQKDIFKKVHMKSESSAEDSETDSVNELNREEVGKLKKEVRIYREAIHR